MFMLIAFGLPGAFAVEEPGNPLLRGQVAKGMHEPIESRPTVTVGQVPGDTVLVGNDHRVLQAAVDYVANLGGGVVKIGPGEYLMNDSLHLRSNVTVMGTPGETVLKKAPSHRSALRLDGDYGEEQVSLENPEGFAVGHGIAIADDHAGGFHTTVARIVGSRGDTFVIDKPLNADCLVSRGAWAATVFPVISGYHVEGAVICHLAVEGNRASNGHLNGCRGAGIFLYRAFGTVIEDCQVRRYAGDGISFQQSNDVRVTRCLSEENTHLGLHPGSGSQRPILRENVARGNGEDGLFLCWRVKFGVFEDNLLEGNGRHGISIGHKDTDNLIRQNRIMENAQDGIYFREESAGMAGHRNAIEGNVIENNARTGIRIEGVTEGVLLRGNTVKQAQTPGIVIAEEVGTVTLDGNEVEAAVEIEDRRKVEQP